MVFFQINFQCCPLTYTHTHIHTCSLNKFYIPPLPSIQTKCFTKLWWRKYAYLLSVPCIWKRWQAVLFHVRSPKHVTRCSNKKERKKRNRPDSPGWCKAACNLKPRRSVTLHYTELFGLSSTLAVICMHLRLTETPAHNHWRQRNWHSARSRAEVIFAFLNALSARIWSIRQYEDWLI